VRVACPSCNGWVAVGFPQTPGRMLGSTAIIAADGAVRAYSLEGYSVGGVRELPEAEQLLRGASIERSAGGVTVKFTATLGEAGIPTSLDDVEMVYANGPRDSLGYHGGGSKGSARVMFQERLSQGVLGQELAGALSGASPDGMVQGWLLVIGCVLSFVVGAAVVVASLNNARARRGYEKPGKDADGEKPATIRSQSWSRFGGLPSFRPKGPTTSNASNAAPTYMVAAESIEVVSSTAAASDQEDSRGERAARYNKGRMMSTTVRTSSADL
jgi:hypothetical protein